MPEVAAGSLPRQLETRFISMTIAAEEQYTGDRSERISLGLFTHRVATAVSVSSFSQLRESAKRPIESAVCLAMPGG